MLIGAKCLMQASIDLKYLIVSTVVAQSNGGSAFFAETVRGVHNRTKYISQITKVRALSVTAR